MDVFAVVLIVVGTAGAVLACTGLQARERRYALIGFAAHVVGSFAQWAVHEIFYDQSGDAYLYLSAGDRLAQLLRLDFARFGPEVLKLAVHLDARLPLDIPEAGTTTGTMSAIAGVFALIVGPSLLSMCLLSTWISWFGQLACYRVAREVTEPDDQKAALVAFFLVPSVIFWGAAFAKEALVFGALGLLILSTHRALRQGRWAYLAGVVIGGGVVLFVKPYTLVPYVVGVAAFTYVDLARRGALSVRLRPLYLALAAGVALGGVVAVGTVFPAYSAEKFTETVANQREAWQDISGGSNMEDSEEARTLLQQVKVLPLALVTALFRPAVFEAKNALALGAALETTVLSVGVLSLLGARRRRLAGSGFLSSPVLVFCVVFVVIFGAAVGLVTRNFGSLSRYRMPMMPFYVFVVLAARRRALAERTSIAPPGTSEVPGGSPDVETGGEQPAASADAEGAQMVH